jgi:F0F1-type ATP synthase assembly protein I
MKKDIFKALSIFFQLGISILIPILLCVFLGRLLDDFFNTGGIIFIIFILLGVGAGFRSAYDLTKSFCEEKNEKEHRFANPKEYMTKDENNIQNSEQNTQNIDKR